MSKLSELLPAGGGGKQVDFVASGVLPNGQAVALKSNGQVEVVAGSAQIEGSEVVYESAGVSYQSLSFDPNNVNKFVIVYRDGGNSGYGTAVVGTVSGSNLSFGTPVVFVSGDSRQITASFNPAGAQFVVSYRNQSATGKLYAVIGTVSGTSISFGAIAAISSANYGNYPVCAFDPNTSNKFIVAFSDPANSYYGTVIVGTVSGTSISFASGVVFNSGSTAQKDISFDPSTANKFVVVYTDSPNSNYGTACVGTLSGTTPSFGTEVVFNSGTTSDESVDFDPNTANKFVVVYRDGSNSNYGTAIAGQVSGSNLSFGTEVVFNAATTSTPIIKFKPSVAYEFVVAYADLTSPTGKINVGTVSNTSITFDSATTFNNAGSEEVGMAMVPSSSGKFVVCYADSGNNTYGTAAVWQIGSTNVSNFIGITDAAITSGESGSVTIKGGVAASVSNTPLQLQPFGSAAVFKAANTGNYGQQSVFLKSGEKFVTIYSSASNSNYGTARVGAVSGTSISYGSESVFNSGAVGTDISIASDPNTADKFVVAYRDVGNSAYGTAIVGTVSGTSISFGSEVVFASATTGYVSVSFDPNTANKFIIAYRDEANLNKGTAIVGTVSGTSLSFGNEVIFNNGGNSSYIDAKFDPSTANKFVVAYQDQANSAYGTAIVGVVSGTNISFGSAAVFNSSNGNRHIGCSFDPNTANKFVVAYRDGGNSNFGSATVGTVSGTSISYGSKSVFNTSASNYIGIDFDPTNANTFVVAYSDGGNLDGYVQIGTVSGTSTSYGTRSLYNSGVVGFNSASFNPTGNKFVVAYSDDSNSGYGTAIIGSLSDNLTIGSTYYVQSDGTVSTVSTSPAVNVGKAISATSLLLKG